MAIPSEIPTVRVTAQYEGWGGEGLKGTVTFTAPFVTFPDSDLFLAGPVVCSLDESGRLIDAAGNVGVRLPATDSPGMNPSGWTYTVKENLTGVTGARTYSMVLPKNTLNNTVDLADVAPADPSTPTYVAVPGPAGEKGDAGPAGARGSKVYAFANATESQQVQAADGDMAVRADTGNVYAYVGGTGYVVKGNIKGPKGDRANALGVYVPDTWGQFWRPKRDAGTARVVVAGDSVSQGYYASNLHSTCWPGVVRTSLQTAHGSGGSGFFSVSRSDAVMGADAAARTAWKANGSLATLTGTWSAGASNFGPGVTYISCTDAATATFKVTGTTVKIFTFAGAAPRSSFTYAIDGAAPVSVTVPVGAVAVQTTTATGLSAGDHTVVVAWSGISGDALYLGGVSGENATGIIVDNMARSGTRVSNWYTGSTLNAPWNGGTSYPADLVVCSLGLNDAAGAVTGAEWVTGMTGYLQSVRAANNGATDIVLVLMHQGAYGTPTSSGFYGQYAAQIRGIAESYGAALINIWALGRNSYAYWNSLGFWGNPVNPGPAGADGVHPSDAGHAFIANNILPVLTS